MSLCPIQNVLVVDFNHARGPEIEFCFPEVLESERPDSWNILPFQALPDGSHLHDEDYSYFTVITDKPDCPTAFGISCNRQLKSENLKVKSKEVTRSTIQKAVLVLTSTPHVFAHIKDKLGAVTRAYFSQLDFDNRDILEKFYEALVARLTNTTDDQSLYTGMPVRQLVHDFRYKVLQLLKSVLLERRILFFGTNIEQLCTAQYSVLSLIPHLLEHLKYCGDPTLSQPEATIRRQETLKTSDRKSMMRYMGMPLQPFNKGSFFGPYTPLQQVELLERTSSYLIGTSNSLFLHAKEKHCDILVNVDNNTIEILEPSLKPALSLSTADRKWADSITTLVEETWDQRSPDIPTTRSFAGSEEHIRNLFEKYIFAMCSLVRYDQYVVERSNTSRPPSPESLLDIEHDVQLSDYGLAFLMHWKKTENFRLWNKFCDTECFDVIEPRHPVIQRNLTVADVQARLSVAVQDLKLDEKTAHTRAAIERTWASGSMKVNKFFSDAAANAEAYREQLRVSAASMPEEEEAKGTRVMATSSKDNQVEHPKDAALPLFQMPADLSSAKSYLTTLKSRWTWNSPAIDETPPTKLETAGLPP